MSGMTTEQKCALYERLLKYLTGATEIRAKSLSEEGDYGFIELVGASPSDAGGAGFDDGLYLDYSSETYIEDYGGAIEPKDDTRIIVEVWFNLDPWAKIKRLEEQVQGLSEKVKE